MSLNFTVKQDEYAPDCVLLLFEQPQQKFGATLRWQDALQFAVAVNRVARQVEEQSKALQLVQDGAILIRSGCPIDISNNPEILKAARREAENMSNVPGVPRTTLVGAPALTQALPRK